MPTTLNYDIVIYGGSLAGVAAACKAATYIKRNGGNKRIAVIIPDVSGMLGGTATAGRQNYVDIKPECPYDQSSDAKYHGGTFGYLYKEDHPAIYEFGNHKINFSVEKMSDLLMLSINTQNSEIAGGIIDLFPDLTDSSTPSGYGYDIVDVTKNSVTGKITSVRIKAMKRDSDGVIRYDSSSPITSEYILTGSVFVDASEDGKLTSVSGVAPSIGRQDWPEDYLPEDDERCYEYSCRQQAATLMFKAEVGFSISENHPESMYCSANKRQPIFDFNEVNDSTIECHPENKFFYLKPWNAAQNGSSSNEWWINALLVFNVDGRAHERDRGTSMFPIDMREDYITTDQAWVMAKEYLKNNKAGIEAALISSMANYHVNSFNICTDNDGNPVVADTMYIRETVHTSLLTDNNTHGSENTNYAVTPVESIKAGDSEGYYSGTVLGYDSPNYCSRIGLAFYNSDINAYEKSDLKDENGNNIWGDLVTSKLRSDLLTPDLIGEGLNPPNAVYMPFEVLTSSRVTNLLIPGVACGVSSVSWSEVRVLPNLCVLGDAAGVSAGYAVINDVDPYDFTSQMITAVQNFLKNKLDPPAILDKPII